MENLTALIALRDKVQAGTVGQWYNWNSAIKGQNENARTAYRGSLDAAKALQEAVLPSHKDRFATYIDNDDDPIVWNVSFYRDGRLLAKGEDTNPARAWLLAILNALIAEAQP